MKKKILLILCMFLIIFNVRAEDCTSSACQNYQACGRCGQDCTWKNDQCQYNTYEGTDIEYSESINVSKVSKVSCGNISGIPAKIPQLTRDIVMILEIVVPIILVLAGSIDLVKGITSGKEDEIKKGQSTLVKRLILAALIFVVIIITKFVVSIVDNSTSSNNIANCIDCFLSDEDSCKEE